VQYDGAAGALSFRATEATSSKSCVWIGDAEYADFSASVEFSSASAPNLRLGPRRVFDAASTDPEAACKLPAFDGAAADGGVLVLDRRGNHLTLRIGAAQSACEVPSQRLPVGVCQSDFGATRVTRLTITRAG
jgi:hypothetical protein